MATIQERAINYAHRNGTEFLSGFENAEIDAYVQGSIDQRVIDLDKYRKSKSRIKEKLIERACEWLLCHDYSKTYSQGSYTDKESLIRDFRKAMTEQNG